MCAHRGMPGAWGAWRERWCWILGLLKAVTEGPRVLESKGVRQGPSSKRFISLGNGETSDVSRHRRERKSRRGAGVRCGRPLGRKKNGCVFILQRMKVRHSSEAGQYVAHSGHSSQVHQETHTCQWLHVKVMSHFSLRPMRGGV